MRESDENRGDHMSKGLVDEQVQAEIGALSWELVEADPPDWQSA